MRKCRPLFLVLCVCIIIHSFVLISNVSALDNEICLASTSTTIPPSLSGVTLIGDELDGRVLTMLTHANLVLENINGVVYQEQQRYDKPSQLFLFTHHNGNSFLGITGSCYTIRSISQPGGYVTGTSSNTSLIHPGADLPNIYWYIYQENGNQRYVFVPCSSTGQVLQTPMISQTGYSPSLSIYNLSNNFVMLRFTKHYSWYSQSSPFNGWQTAIYPNASQGAIPITQLTYESGAYGGRTVTSVMEDEGCHLNSVAMILANMEYYTANSKYDPRLGSTLKIFADPYTTAMANLDIDDWSVTSDGVIDGFYNNPMLTWFAKVSAPFNVTHSAFISYEGYTVREKAQAITSALLNRPQGIILVVNRGAYDHSVVCVISQYQGHILEENIDDCFYIFDSGTNLHENGANVPISATIFTISDVKGIYYIDPIS